ncbi:MAG: hypothetical protein JWP95_1648 [Actinotalea sp.]|nr:hypothetical protein [Actinotalea sp.]
MSTVEGRRPEDLDELLAAYALDAVDDVERRTVERHVAQDPDAARELRSLRETAAKLGASEASAPPAALRAALLSQIATTPQEGRPTPQGARADLDDRTAPLAAPGRRTARRMNEGFGRRALQLAVAAALVGAIGVPTVTALQERGRAIEAEQRADLLSDVLADPSAEVLRAEVSGGGAAVAVLTDDRALLVADGLEELDDDHVYQLWAMRDGEALPSTLLPPAEDGTVQALAEGYRAGDGLALTIEPAGGSEVATTAPILVLLPG